MKYSVFLSIPVKDCNEAIMLESKLAQLAANCNLPEFTTGIDEVNTKYTINE
tara:strand:+ start:2792 stop:2947 length:156 start_codon:yes stop_codon:yes gene_type:complete